MRILVGDNETTGLGGPPEVMACEIAIVELDWDLNIIGQWESLINPGIEIQPGAMKIHGITDEMVQRPEMPTITEAFAEIAPEGFGDVALICHNIRFDRQFFAPHMNIAAELCTLELARRVLPTAPNHRLGTLKTHLNLSVQKEHEGMGDVMTVVDLLRYLVPYTGRSLKQLIAAAAQPSMLYIMPFGQYKGKPMLQVPVDYRNYLLQQVISPDLRYTFEQMQRTFA